MPFISPNNEYPRFIGDIQIDHPAYKEGDPLPAGWREVQEQPVPTIDIYEVASEDFPIQDGDLYLQNWVVREMTPAEREAKDAPETARQRMLDLGFTEAEIESLVQRMVR